MSWLINNFESLGNRTAIIDVLGEFSYEELFNQINKYKSEINEHIEKGDIVALLSDYNFYSIALMLALYEKKAIIVPIVSQNQQEIESRLKVCPCDYQISLDDTKIKIGEKSHKSSRHNLIQNLIDTQESGLVLFSSGSTGEPKAMIHNLDNLVNSYSGKKPKKLNILVFLMFDHIGGINTLLNNLSMGAKIILPENRNPDYIARLIETHSVHVLPSTPTFLNMMLMAKVNEKYNLKSLKLITYGTEVMPNSVLVKLKSVFPRARIMQTFGTSETGIAQTTSRASDSLDMKIDDPNTEYKIVDNELWLRSKTQVLGYLNADMTSFTEDGWFKTGDLVEQSDDGFIKIVGRNKEVINVGGEKVLPGEVESSILELDIVDDCMVYAEKNAITGQSVGVQIVLTQDCDEKEGKKIIRQHCKNNLEAYKVPTKYKFVENTNASDRFKKMRLQ